MSEMRFHQGEGMHIEHLEQENMNIPLGPEHLAEMWRAQSRLSIAVFGSICWTASACRKISVMTRVQEKGALWTSFLLKKIVSMCKEQGLFAASPASRRH